MKCLINFVKEIINENRKIACSKSKKVANLDTKVRKRVKIH